MKKNLNLILIAVISIIIIGLAIGIDMFNNKTEDVSSEHNQNLENLINEQDIEQNEISENIIENNIIEENVIVNDVKVTTTPTTNADKKKETTTKNNSSNNIPYYIKVNYGAQVVTIYKKDDDGKYTVPVKAMVCSTGVCTPKSGVYSIPARWKWLGLQGNVYGQYCTQITGNILFHSVPYLTKGDPGSLEYWEYDKLGTYASAGCIRLTVKDAKWIYENCKKGTRVEFYSSSNPGPLGKPTAKKISNAEGDLKNWDPTDPNPDNPWKNHKEETNNKNENTITNTQINTNTQVSGNTTTNTQTNTNTQVSGNTTTNTQTNTNTQVSGNTTTNTQINTNTQVSGNTTTNTQTNTNTQVSGNTTTNTQTNTNTQASGNTMN